MSNSGTITITARTPDLARLAGRDDEQLPVCHEARHARGLGVARGKGSQRIRQAGAGGLRMGGGRKA